MSHPPLRDYPREEPAAQPISAWSGEIHRRAVGALRARLAAENPTQPHWWTLNHVAGAPGTWTRATLTARLTPYEDLGIDFDTVYGLRRPDGPRLADRSPGKP
ncbi:hypothetical protein [Streptomyces sp. NPDC006134]|uniref:hypothetical protein n=1 Tax=Streptomyces sp. NPDC006134 TaxID=3154467 RepID=UPI0033DF31B1